MAKAEGAEPPNKMAYCNAHIVLTVAEVLKITVEYVTASVNGGIVVCFKRDEMYADIECFNSGEAWAIVSDHIKPPQTWQLKSVSREAIEATLKKICSMAVRELSLEAENGCV